MEIIKQIINLKYYYMEIIIIVIIKQCSGI